MGPFDTSALWKVPLAIILFTVVVGIVAVYIAADYDPGYRETRTPARIDTTITIKGGVSDTVYRYDFNPDDYFEEVEVAE